VRITVRAEALITAKLTKSVANIGSNRLQHQNSSSQTFLRNVRKGLLASFAKGPLEIQLAVFFYLGIDPAQLDGMRDAADGQHVSRDAVVDAVGFGEADHGLKGFTQDELQLLIDR
jgi:hypothetical protein